MLLLRPKVLNVLYLILLLLRGPMALVTVVSPIATVIIPIAQVVIGTAPITETYVPTAL